MKAIAICLILVGIIWALWVALIYLVMSGMAEPISVAYTSIYYAALLIGPILLIAGPILVLNRSNAKLGVVLTLISCAILTISVGHETILGLHVEPLQAKPPYLLFGVMIMVTLLSDIGAIWLCRLVASNATL